MKKKAKVRVDKNQRVIDLLNKQALQIKYLSDKVDYLSIALAGFSKPYALTPFTITSTSSSNFCTDGKTINTPTLGLVLIRLHVQGAGNIPMVRALHTLLVQKLNINNGYKETTSKSC